MRPRWILPLLAAVAACGDPPSETPRPPADPEVVAVYGGGRVTASDVDRAVLDLPASRRQPGPEQTAAEWYRALIRELVIDRVLEHDATLLPDDDPELGAALDEARRQALMEIYFERNPPAVAEVTDEDVRRYYHQHPERYDRPARRLVSHLFKRRPAGGSVAELKVEVEALRRRAIAGESFGTLAAAHSDSESRHRQGHLGWVTRGQVAPELAEVIFALPEGTPSEPLTTAEGVHLFRVEKAVEAKRFAFDEVAALIRRELRQARRQEALERAVAELPPPGGFVAEPGEVAALLEAGDPEALVLESGDYRLTVARLRALLAQSRQQQTPGQLAPPDLAQQLVRRVEQRERVVHHAEAAGLAEDPAVAERLARLEQQIARRIRRQRGLLRQLGAEPERLRAYYEDNKPRFSSPLRLELHRLTVPIAGRPADRVMRRLEQLAGGAGGARARLESAAAELGGEIETLGWRSLAELARLDRRWAGVAARLEAGRLSPPLSDGTAIEMLEVTARREPEPLPFAAATDAVRAAYLDDHGQQLYLEWSEGLLAEAGFTAFPERLEGLAAAVGAPHRDQ